jgi:hypothetical protein
MQIYGPVLALLVTSSSALPESGILKSGPGTSPEAQRAAEAAERQPNATSSIDFTRTFNNTPETWTWRINTTELSVPDPFYNLGKADADYSQGLRVANIQWQLRWPGSGDDDGSFQSFLIARNATAQFNTVILSLPSNITDRYPDENGNCATVLSEECIQSLTDDGSSREGCENNLSVNVVGGVRSGMGFSK